MSIYNTPLRYPGGKQRLTPFVHEILEENQIDGHYVEPYAGGAGIAIELLVDKKVQHIHLNDCSLGIYAFWHSVVNHPEEFCRLISSASLTIDEWKKRKEIVKQKDTSDLLNLGFSTFFLNRCNRSGILNAGVIGGYAQAGAYKIDARFNRNELIRRIELISLYRDRISVSNLDAEFYLKNYIPNLPENTLVYCDPPYFVKGSDLYPNYYAHKDHIRLSEVIQSCVSHRWILSYDGAPEIIEMYRQRRHFLYDLQYSAAKAYMGKEIFIFSDLVNIPTKASIKSINYALSLSNFIAV